MEHIFCFGYKTKVRTAECQDRDLEELHIMRVNPCNEFQYTQNSTTAYSNLSSEQPKFEKMLRSLIREVAQLQESFVNVTLIGTDVEFFEEVLPRECANRKIPMPYLLTNFVDLKKIIRECYCCPYSQWASIAHFLQVQSADGQLQTVCRISQKAFSEGHIKLTSLRLSSVGRQHGGQGIKKRSAEIEYQYFKITGLPFKIFEQEVLETLAPEISSEEKDIVFLFEREKFSGRAIIKVPHSYASNLITKNKTYIGNRYIELQKSSLEKFETNKIQRQLDSQKYLSEKRSNPQNTPAEKNQSNSLLLKRQINFEPPHSRQDQQMEVRERSREKSRVQNSDKLACKSSDSEYGIKVRGLPFAFTEWDVENIFRYYNIVEGTVKMGVKSGTQLKNGEAVILTRSYNDAQKALAMEGFKCMGRYIEVKAIPKEQYCRFRP